MEQSRQKVDQKKRSSEMDEHQWKSSLLQILENVEHHGDFCVSESVNVPYLHPKIWIEGLSDRIAYPLTTGQAESIKSIAEKAPYGKGRETVLDESVRKAWQIDASKVKFDSTSEWNKCFSTVVENCKKGLGIKNDVSVKANLYKLLLYEPGGHFLRHRDTEKEPGMFGTLILQLPSKYEGGAFVIEHRGVVKTIEHAAQSEDSFFVTAFYADCEHTLHPITSGWRLCLAYNLILVGRRSVPDGFLPNTTYVDATARQLQTLAEKWNTNCSTNFQALMLEHKYTETNLSFVNLKGNDKGVVSLLQNAKDSQGRSLFVVCLLRIRKTDRGTPAMDYRHPGYGYDSDDEPHGLEMGDVHDSTVEVMDWIGPDGTSLTDSNLDPEFNFDEHLLHDPYSSFEGDPDSMEYEGYMGNYGPELEYQYERGAVIFWPRSNNGVFLATFGFHFLASYLNAADEHEVINLGQTAIKILEKDSKLRATSTLLNGLLRTGKSAFVISALDRSVNIEDQDFASALVKISLEMGHLKEICDALRGLVKRSLCTRSMHSSFPGWWRHDLDHLVKFSDGLKAAGPRAHCLWQTVSTDIIQTALEGSKRSIEDIKQCDTDDQCANLQTTLSSLLDLLVSQVGSVDDERVRPLVQHRVMQLRQRVGGGQPEFSWRQPKADFNGSQSDDVNAFLRSDQKAKTFYGFEGISHAGNWASKYFGSRCRHTYSAKAEAGYSNGKPSVTVTKTKGDFEKEQKARYKSDLKELEKWESMLGIDGDCSLEEAVRCSSKRATQMDAVRSEVKRRKPQAKH